MINYDEIDENIRDTIKILNDKGYETICSCEGHWKECYNRYWGGFIGFKYGLNDKYIPKQLGIYVQKPKDKTLSQVKNSFISCEKNLVIYFDGDSSKRKTKEQKEKEHFEFLNELKLWAENLPIIYCNSPYTTTII